jgi:ribonuclease P/MRP protein subunit RPP1
MSYYLSNLHAIPDGSDSPSRLALSARRLGYSGIVICNHTGLDSAFGPEAAKNIRRIDVAWGIEVVSASTKGLQNQISSVRDQVDFLSVHGGTEVINRAACEDPSVDMLAHPDCCGQSLSIAAVRAASQNEVAIGFDLRPMIQLRGGPRSKWLTIFRRNLELARKFDLEMIINTDARSHLDLRAPREMITLAKLAGMEQEEAEAALMYPQNIIELNRKRWAGPGVELL